MIKIRRLNMDSSWQMHWQGVSMIIDPWLTGSEIDGFSWLNEQWHNTEPVAPEDISQKDLVIITQPYTDHCHAATIERLRPFGEMMAVKPAKRRLEKEIGEKRLILIPDIIDGWAEYGKLEIAKISPNKWIDPIYHALIIKCDNDVIFYSPHGFELSTSQMQMMQGFKIKLLITSFSYFRIPAIMGGVVNPGVDAAMKLAGQLNAQNIINTHDEEKEGKGLVLMLAKKKYADIRSESKKDHRITVIENYDYHNF